ncbi:hypothetical protein GcC1_147001 [Golovinomyces cichoracearum]|uniref:Uncharacterized protein n=1 Tax=Golovinomyces cichoracearum TaxID=62708 RepID=A0A420HYJ5_9PEZI|nr:hypothetical protein GcC1_147001 [Golovinomyces cichoracearum]
MSLQPENLGIKQDQESLDKDSGIGDTFSKDSSDYNHELADADIDAGKNGKMNDQIETKDLGWNKKSTEILAPFFDGTSNEELWTLIRRFNTQISHVKAIAENPPGTLGLRTSEHQEFSPEKLRANLERFYMTIVTDLVCFWKHISRLRSWSERKRTFAFAMCYTVACVFDILLPTMILFLIILTIYPPARSFCFPPRPIVISNSRSGTEKTPESGEKASNDSLTGVSENYLGEALEYEASNFVAAIAQISISSALGKNSQKNYGSNEEETDKLDNHTLDPEKIAMKAVKTKKKVDGNKQGLSQDKSEEPMSSMMWSSSENFMNMISDVSNVWECFGNALTSPALFPRIKPRLRIAAVLALILQVSLLTSSYIFMKISSILAGVIFFGNPLIGNILRYIDCRYPHWRKLFKIRNSLLRGVPTNAQLTLTLLRRGELKVAPIPPQPPTTLEGSNLPSKLPESENGEESGENAKSRSRNAVHETNADSKNEHHGRLFLTAAKQFMKGGVETILSTDRLKAAVGSEDAKNRLGILETKTDNSTGPVHFPCRFKGEQGYSYISLTRAKSILSWKREGSDIDASFSINISDIREMKKVGGLGWKSKIIVGWSTSKVINDGLVITDKEGKISHLTAIPQRDELFNRLVALGNQTWEAL